MALPPPGNVFATKYINDDGVINALTVTGSTVYAESYPGDASGEQALAFWVQPRHFLCRRPNGYDDCLAKVICPQPFSEMTNITLTSLITAGGIEWEVIARVGEVNALYS